MKLGTRLLRDGVIGLSELEAALRAQVLYGGRLGTNLVELGFLDVDTVGRFLALATGAPEATRDHFERVPPSDIEHFGAQLAEAETAFPLGASLEIPGSLAVAVLDPNDTDKRDRIAEAIDRRVVLYTAAEMRLFFYLEKHYGVERQVRYVRSSSPPREQGKVERRRLQGAPRVVIEPRRRSSARMAAVAGTDAPGPATVDGQAVDDGAIDDDEADALATTLADAHPAPTPGPKTDAGGDEDEDEDEVTGAALATTLADAHPAPSPATDDDTDDEIDPDAATDVLALASTLADAHPAPPPAPATDDDDDTDGRTLAGAHPYKPRPPAPPREDVDADADTQAGAYAETAPAAVVPDDGARVRPRDSNEISRVIECAEHRDDIGEALMSFAPGRLDALVVLLIRDRMAMGWRAYAPSHRGLSIDQLSIPLSELSTLKLAYDANETYWGPPPDRNGLAEIRLWASLGITPVPERILVVPVSVRDRVVNLIATTAEEVGGVTRGQLNGLAKAASEAYLRMIRSFRTK